MTPVAGPATRAADLASLRLDSYAWVCVDMFDTLVVRTVHPEDVKRLVCERLARVVAPGLDGAAVYELRATVERELCLANAAKGLDPEFSLDRCLRAMAEHKPGLAEDGVDAFVRLGLEIEIAVECSVQELDTDVVEWVRSLAGRSTRCALVSDFYLPAVYLRRLLSYHGVEESFEHVFSSADDYLTKRSGRKYPVIITALGCEPSQVLVVGDNAVADMEQARAHGLAAFHLDRSARQDAYLAMAQGSGRTATIAGEIGEALGLNDSSDEAGPVIFPELALTLFCFIERLYEALVARGARDVFFLSREGQPLRRMFDAYQARRTPTEQMVIRSHYLEASRRSLFLPSLGPLGEERFETLFRQYRRISWGDFLRSLGLDDLVETLATTLVTDSDQRLEDLPTSPEFRTLIADRRFGERYEEERLRRRSAFLSYLDRFSRPVSGAPLTIVDIGWKGTIQDNLVRLLNTACDERGSAVMGFYLGLVGPVTSGVSGKKQGLLFSSDGSRTPWFHVFAESRPLFEVTLAADHGSTAAYAVDGAGRAHPVRDQFPERAMVLEHMLPELRLLEERFHRLDALLLRRRYSPRWLLAQTAKHHSRMVFAASDREIEWFTQLSHVENFGAFETTGFGSPPITGRRQRLRFAASLLRHQGRMSLGSWPWLRCVQQGGRPVGAAYHLGLRVKAILGR